jgi:hypothetical protein
MALTEKQEAWDQHKRTGRIARLKRAKARHQDAAGVVLNRAARRKQVK